MMILCLITWYLLTTDATGGEGTFDIIKDYAALMSVLEFDDVLITSINLKFEHIEERIKKL